jgi:hypothetical protein
VDKFEILQKLREIDQDKVRFDLKNKNNIISGDMVRILDLNKKLVELAIVLCEPYDTTVVDKYSKKRKVLATNVLGSSSGEQYQVLLCSAIEKVK